MPVDLRRYPADWEQIVAEVRSRAGNRCERCNVPNGAVGARHPITGAWHDRAWWIAQTADPDEDSHDGDDGLPTWWPRRMIRIVLTTAHLDALGDVCQCETKTGRKCGDLAHLRYLCQRCHLGYDRPRHQRNAAAFRRRNTLRIQPELGLLP